MSAKRAAPEPPKQAGAPAYMGQYASLMTILLAFFIIMLSLGQDRVAQFKDGVGQIQNLIGVTGGTGVLQFWRSLRRPPVPVVTEIDEEDPEAMLIGYHRHAEDSFSIPLEDLERIRFEHPRQGIRLRSGIRFDPGSAVRVSRDARFALDQAAASLYALNDYTVTVAVLVGSGDVVADRALATRRAAWLVRHFVDQAGVPPDRLRAMGMAVDVSDEGVEVADVLFLLRRLHRDGTAN